MIYNSILETIGSTPHLKLNKLFGSKQQVFLKLERNNPGGSIKDRIALAMIENAEQNGFLVRGSTIVEPTSGNTGVGLALVAAYRGYRLILVMPESMSIERRKLMQAYGAEFVLTPKEKGMKGAIEKAIELAETIPGAFVPQQFNNISNVEAHRKTTAKEILRDFPGGLDYLITGVGTGGHITGVGEILKQHFPKLKVIAVEPELSPVLSGGNASPHPLQGIGAGFVPSILNLKVLDDIIQVSKDDAYKMVKDLAKKEGVLAGISTGASLAAVAKKLPEVTEGAKILTFNYDTGERYLSVEDLF
jgi:cysteine synthase